MDTRRLVAVHSRLEMNEMVNLARANRPRKGRYANSSVLLAMSHFSDTKTASLTVGHRPTCFKY
ncbi:MAG: hypothetical protein PVH19_06990 [Planctomycetia bacterium]